MTFEKLTFDSISALPQWIDAHPRETNCTDSETYRATQSHDGGWGYDKAIDTARKGGLWEEGGKLVKEVTLKMADLKTKGRVPALDTDVAGFLPDVPAMLAGDPCHMWADDENETQDAPIIKVGVHPGMSSGATFEQTLNRGAAILSVVDELENNGYRVELWAVNDNSTPHDRFQCSVLVKSADEHWSPASAAFALCNSAFNRRILWRLGESIESLNQFCVSFGKGEKRPEGFDVWFPYLLARDRSWDTPAIALKHITESANQQLTRLEEAV